MRLALQRWHGVARWAVLLALLWPAGPPAVAAAEQPAAAVVAGRVVALFDPATSPARRAAVLGRYPGVTALGSAAVHPALVRLRVPAGQEPAIAALLRAEPGVRAAAADRRAHAASIPSDYSAGQQPNLERVGTPSAWAAGASGAGVTIAVVDSGLDTGHPDFDAAGKVVAPAVFVSDPSPSFLCGPTSADVLDNYGHGTHVAGLAAADGNDGGIVGVAWQARLMPIKVLDACGVGTFADIATGIHHAAAAGARVINLSLGGYLRPAQPDEAALIAIVQEAVDRAVGAGAVVVAAVGNDSRHLDQTPFYPAAAREVVGVAATTNADTPALFSNYGTAVDVAAPGVDIYSTLPTYPTQQTGLHYGSLSGTSMAAPHVAGLAALLVQRDAALGAADLAALLQGTAVEREPPGRDDRSGVGRIDVGAALTRPAPVPIRYFAEGYTGSGFTEYLTLVNTTTRPAVALLRFQYAEGGGGLAHRYLALPSTSRVTQRLNDLVGAGEAVAVVLATDSPGVYAERPIYFLFNGRIDGGHVAAGATAPATTWHFAEGYTGPDFYQYLTIQNPGTDPAAVRVTYRTAGGPAAPRTLTVAAGQRATVAVHDAASGVGRDQAVATTVESTNGVGIVVERPIYFVYTPAAGGGPVTGGHTVVGATSLSTSWYFAEGYTGAGFDQYVTLLNPQATATVATLRYYLEGGGTQQRAVPLPAQSRVTVVVHEPASAANPGGLGRGYASGLMVTSPLPIVAERPMYFTYASAGTAGITGGHTTLGAPAPRAVWYFAEGYTGTGFDEYLVLLNPGTVAAPVTLTYYLGTGQVVTRDLVVGAGARRTVAVHGTSEGVGRGQAVSARVESTTGAGIVVERSMYFTDGNGLTGGHTALGQ